jgi:hypothetical protein
MKCKWDLVWNVPGVSRNGSVDHRRPRGIGGTFLELALKWIRLSLSPSQPGIRDRWEYMSKPQGLLIKHFWDKTSKDNPQCIMENILISRIICQRDYMFMSRNWEQKALCLVYLWNIIIYLKTKATKKTGLFTLLAKDQLVLGTPGLVLSYTACEFKIPQAG